MWADPPGRRSIVALWPNQLARPSAVVSAAQTFAGGWASSSVRSIRSGNPMATSTIATVQLLPTLLQPYGCVNLGYGLLWTVGPVSCGLSDTRTRARCGYREEPSHAYPCRYLRHRR